MTRLRFLSLAMVSFLAITASATTIRRLTLEQVRDRAESIFVGHVVSSSVRAVANGELQATDYQIEVTETLYGTVPRTTTVTYIGGPAQAIDGVPRIELDRDYVFFRTAQPNNTTIGWGQGLFRIETANVGGVDRKVLISGDGESLVMINGVLSRGGRVEVVQGKVVAASADQPVQHAVEGTPIGANPPRAVVPAAPLARPAATPATLDDLRRFVRARGASTR